MSTLFDDQLRARFNDPDTSQAAAASIRPVLGQECWRVLQATRAVAARTGAGATAWEVRRELLPVERDQNVIARRLTDLRDAGFVSDSGARRPGKSGRPLIVWELTS